MTEHVLRHAITHVGPHGRRLTFAMQGRFTWPTAEEAEANLAAFADGLRRVLSPEEHATLAVRPCRCYPVHHDPVSYYFPEDELAASHRNPLPDHLARSK